MTVDLLLGAHVSTAGGPARAPERGRVIGATAIQIFTKVPNQWREPVLTEAQGIEFRAAMAKAGIAVALAHDSYLINLASPDRKLRARSVNSFKAELERCRVLGVPFVATHPGNYIDDREAGLERNAEAYATCLAAVDGPTILIEGTAGTGTALGSTFAELARLRQLIPSELQRRVQFCLDTCHLHAAGYDLVGAWDDVWDEWNRLIGLEHLRCFHLNDSKTALGARRDRHAWIAEGTIGPEPFRKIMRDPRFAGVIKIIETPKGDDPLRHDRRMLRRLRAYARVRSTNAA